MSVVFLHIILSSCTDHLYLRENSNRRTNFISFLCLWPESPGFHLNFLKIFLNMFIFIFSFTATVCFVKDMTLPLSESALNISVN